MINHGKFDIRGELTNINNTTRKASGEQMCIIRVRVKRTTKLVDSLPIMIFADMLNDITFKNIKVGENLLVEGDIVQQLNTVNGKAFSDIILVARKIYRLLPDPTPSLLPTAPVTFNVNESTHF